MPSRKTTASIPTTGTRIGWGFIALLMFMLIASGISKGRASGRFGYSVSREGEPLLFWLYIAGWCVLAAGATYLTLRRAQRPTSDEKDA